ncbi:MAG: hypothetical protein KME55_39395 [Nostoc indistinguendum CM1-VF10]|jgi:hypothetical protein|nr:hypothetical protein [Nostoc indistinguendum CM1-VF10]
MSLLLQDESTLDIALGRVLRIPCKFIQGQSSVNPTLIKNISQQLQATGKNILPIIIKALGEDNFVATLNIHILEAARQAKLDFVWCIVVDDKMQSQVKIESGQIVQVNILTASEQEIIDTLEYIQTHITGFKTIKPNLVAKAIVEYRKTKTAPNLSFLTKLRCGIGKAKVDPLSEFLVVA